MTIPYSTEWKNKGLRITFTGIVIGGELVQLARGVYGDRRFDELRYHVMDFSQVESFDMTERETKNIAYMDMAAARSNPDTSVAIVAHQDIGRKLAQLYASYSEPSPWEIRIFDTLQEAEQWLSSLGWST
jgi:hypothetical protein